MRIFLKALGQWLANTNFRDLFRCFIFNCQPEDIEGGASHYWRCRSCGRGWSTFHLRKRGMIVDAQAGIVKWMSPTPTTGEVAMKKTEENE